MKPIKVTKKDGKVVWRLKQTRNGKVKWMQFSTKFKALAKLKELNAATKKIGEEATEAIADKRILRWVELEAKLQDHRLSLEQVALDRLKAMEGVESQKTLQDAFALYEKDMLARNRSRDWRQTVNSTCLRFLTHVGGDTKSDAISTKVVEDYLEGLKKRDGSLVSTRTKENNRLKLSGFFRFCVKKGWMSEAPTPESYREELETNEAFHEVDYLKVEQVSTLLSELDESSYYKQMMRVFVLLGLYCGIRPQEFRKKVTYQGKEHEHFLTWSDIDLKKNTLTLSKRLSKTKKARKVPIPDCAIGWLFRWFGDEFPAKDKAIVPTWHSKKYSHLKANLTIELSHDMLRHTFGTYRTALVGASKAATEMGNSGTIVLAHYAEAVDAKEAEEFFLLSPEKVLGNNKVIGMKTC